METSSKEIYKNIFALVKSLDEQKKNIRDISDIFSDDFQQKRKKLIELCQLLLFSEFDNIPTFGKKIREILWRKGFYDIISIAKYAFAKSKTIDPSIQIVINEGILVFKAIILNFESILTLELNSIIDMKKITDLTYMPMVIKKENKDRTIEEISFAWDLIHASLISIGDLYRYLLGFNLSPETVTESVVAEYYEQAFKLNPTIGMAQNQLGTLYAGKNYEIDSIYFYISALLCKTSFELSEGNVVKIFEKNAIYLESNEVTNESLVDAHKKFKQFMARFVLMVDIFFYDKEVNDFTNLCHSVLIDVKYMLDGRDEGLLSENILFKMTAILIFCLHKLKLNDSKKVHSLNAFLVAFTSELLDKCITSVAQFIAAKEAQNIIFSDKYNRIYTKFEDFVRKKTIDENIQRCQTIVKQNQEEDELPIKSFTEKNTSSCEENKTGAKEFKKLVRHRRRRPQLSNCTDTDESDIDNDVYLSDSEESYISYNNESSNSSDCSIENDIESQLNETDSDSGDDIIILKEEIVYPNKDEKVKNLIDTDAFMNNEEDFLKDLIVKFEELSGAKYRSAYSKIDPNIIIEFCTKEKCFKALKILFDWMYLNPDIVIGCYISNPEFVHKIMRLINYINIDIFTRKIYFDRSLITHSDLRRDLRSLFDIRRTIAIEEDENLKRFAMFESLQQSIDWELSYKLQITKSEMAFLRLFKLIDFGFHLSKMRKFHYYFCAKDRIFIERIKKRSVEADISLLRKKKNKQLKSPYDNGLHGRKTRQRRNRSRRERGTDTLEKPTVSKRYLKTHIDQSRDITLHLPENKCTVRKGTKEKMAELWLHNEVCSLENKMKNEKSTNMILTPYIVVDTKALTEFTAVVKNMLSTKKFVILVPLCVLSELDELKKSNEQNGEQARNVIKWLEKEFTKGNRFLRPQRQNEILPLPMIKAPKKIDRETNVFIQIASFCNYMVTHNNQDRDFSDIITLLTGDNHTGENSDAFSYNGILDTIPVKYEHIINFYSRCKKK